jgi:Rieske Fe-S protein
MWPFLDQMNPDARVRAVGDVVDVNVADLQPAQQRVVRWHNFPIFVVGRTPFSPAQYNLPVPPYDIVGRSRIVIGKNAGGAIFSLESVERI